MVLIGLLGERLFFLMIGPGIDRRMAESLMRRGSSA